MSSKVFAWGLCLIGLTGLTGIAGAQGVRLSGTLSQSFDLNNNQNLSGGGTTLDSRTGFGLTLSSQTPTSRISASTGAALRFNSNGNASLSRPQLSLRFGHDTKPVKYSGGLSFSRREASVDVTQPDLSILSYSGDETRINANLGASTQLNARTSFSVRANGSFVDYDPVSAGLFPTTDLKLTGNLSYQLSPTTTLGLVSSVGYFNADNASDTTSVSFDLSGRATYQLDQITSINGGLGLAFIETTDTVLGVQSSSFAVSVLFNGGVSRQLPDGSVGLSISQGIAPSSSGSLVLDTKMTGSYSKTVNQLVSVGVDATVGRQENVGGGRVRTFVGISPRYSRQLTRDITANANYYFQRDNTGATSNGISVSIGRKFDFPL